MPHSNEYSIKEVMEKNHLEDMEAHRVIIKRLDSINGRVHNNEVRIAQAKAIGVVAVIVVPLVIEWLFRIL